jgi:hypothetical protein
MLWFMEIMQFESSPPPNTVIKAHKYDKSLYICRKKIDKTKKYIETLF